MGMEINIKKARTCFSELIERAERGEQIVVTRRGKPAARIVPSGPTVPPGRLPDLSAHRASIKLRGTLTEAVVQERAEPRR
jgi:prevent-host-death family protein